MKILVCWEDRYHGKLDLCLRRAVQMLEAPPELRLFFDDVRGNGGFEPYLKQDWPKAVRVGLPKSQGPMDALLFVADADRVQQCAAVAPPPPAPASTQAWLDAANQAWTERLRAAAPLAAERVHGRFLRWNQESLLIAGHDHPRALSCLGCREPSGVLRYLQRCAPNPAEVSDALFVDQFRKPGRCLQELLAAGKAAPLKKGDPELDDALDELSRSAMPQLGARITDLTGLASLIQTLAS